MEIIREVKTKFEQFFVRINDKESHDYLRDGYGNWFVDNVDFTMITNPIELEKMYMIWKKGEKNV